MDRAARHIMGRANRPLEPHCKEGLQGREQPTNTAALSLTFLTFWLAGISQLITPVETLIDEETP